MSFLGRGKKKAPEAATKSPQAADPLQAAMGNAYVQQMLDSETASKSLSKVKAGSAAPTPEMIKALGAQITAAKAKEAADPAKVNNPDVWKDVPAELRPERTDGELRLANAIEDDRTGRTAAKKREEGIVAPQPAARPAQATRLNGTTDGNIDTSLSTSEALDKDLEERLARLDAPAGPPQLTRSPNGPAQRIPADPESMKEPSAEQDLTSRLAVLTQGGGGGDDEASPLDFLKEPVFEQDMSSRLALLDIETKGDGASPLDFMKEPSTDQDLASRMAVLTAAPGSEDEASPLDFMKEPSAEQDLTSRMAVLTGGAKGDESSALESMKEPGADQDLTSRLAVLTAGPGSEDEASPLDFLKEPSAEQDLSARMAVLSAGETKGETASPLDFLKEPSAARDADGVSAIEAALGMEDHSVSTPEELAAGQKWEDDFVARFAGLNAPAAAPLSPEDRLAALSTDDDKGWQADLALEERLYQLNLEDDSKSETGEAGLTARMDALMAGDDASVSAVAEASGEDKSVVENVIGSVSGEKSDADIAEDGEDLVLTPEQIAANAKADAEMEARLSAMDSKQAEGAVDKLSDDEVDLVAAKAVKGSVPAATSKEDDDAFMAKLSGFESKEDAEAAELEAQLNSPEMTPGAKGGKVAAPVVPSAPAKGPSVKSSLGETALGASAVVGQVGGIAGQAGRGAEAVKGVDLLASASKMDASGVQAGLKSGGAIGSELGAGAFSAVADGLSVGASVERMKRGHALMESPDVAKQELGKSLVQRAEVEATSSGASMVNTAVSVGGKAAEFAGASGAMDSLASVIPGLGIVTSAASLIKNSAALDEATTFSDKTSQVTAELGADPMAALAENAQGNHDRNKSRARRNVALDVASIGAGITTLAAPPIGAMASAGVTVAKGANAAANLISDNKSAYDVQSLRAKALLGDRAAKRALLRQDPRMLAHGLALFASAKPQEGESEESAKRRVAAAKIMGAMGVSSKASAEGSAEDLRAIVTERTHSSPDMLMSHQKVIQGAKMIYGAITGSKTTAVTPTTAITSESAASAPGSSGPSASHEDDLVAQMSALPTVDRADLAEREVAAQVSAGPVVAPKEKVTPAKVEKPRAVTSALSAS